MEKSYKIAGGIAAAAALWIASGAVFQHDEPAQKSAADKAAAGDTAETQRVQVATLAAEPWLRELSIAGRTAAMRGARLKAETAGTVVKLVAQRGDHVKAGAPLIELAQNDRAAKLREAEALVAKRELEYRAQDDLAKKSFTSEVALANAKAQLESARAMQAAAQLDIARTVIRAPFDGVFNLNKVEQGDSVKSGDDVAEFVDLDPIKILADVAEISVGELSIGKTATAVLITGRRVEGPVTYISAVADPTTRTYLVEMAVPNPANDPEGWILPGMTASIALPARQVMAHRIPPSILTLDDAGAVGIKILDDRDEVRFVPVRTVANTADNIWIEGLPPTIRVITLGQEYVKVGQRVIAVEAPPKTLAPDATTAPATETPTAEDAVAKKPNGLKPGAL
ncbi:MAG: efflux RND transporter periplasmic adaptor subunit [Rhodospirillaceae bacterium]|nr:efflux RND transporter periplasmic adaptor subunit [Rhodospirillaceae bacterium]